jgi:hypothetical protein
LLESSFFDACSTLLDRCCWQIMWRMNLYCSNKSVLVNLSRVSWSISSIFPSFCQNLNGKTFEDACASKHLLVVLHNSNVCLIQITHIFDIKYMLCIKGSLKFIMLQSTVIRSITENHIYLHPLLKKVQFSIFDLWNFTNQIISPFAWWNVFHKFQ